MDVSAMEAGKHRNRHRYRRFSRLTPLHYPITRVFFLYRDMFNYLFTMT